MNSSQIKYSISDIAKLSGVKAHTIRIWEQRYGIVKPKRSETKIRYYTDEDVKHLMNVSVLNRNGIKISKIAELCTTEIQNKVCNLENVCCTHQMTMDQLIKCMVSFDEMLFEKILNAAIIQHGFKTVMLEIIYPFLERIGILWLTGSITPAQEHFITNLVRQKIIVAIDGQVVAQNSSTKRIVMLLPQKEMHEPVIDVYQPDYIFSVLTSSMNMKQTIQAFTITAKNNKDLKLMFAGSQAFQLSKTKLSNVYCFSSLNEVIKFRP